MILKNADILVIDDDTDVLTAVKLLLKTEVKEVITAKNPELIQSLITSKKFDIVLLDMNFKSSINTGNEGIYWLRKIKELAPDLNVIMITAYGDIDLAVRSLKEGASDFILKPWHNAKLLEAIKEILKAKSSSTSDSKNISVNDKLSEMIGESEVMKQIFLKINKIAPTDANIFILGENGTGKDLIAKEIHHRSLRSENAFVKVDVGALSESLFESELFGYKKGAFTGATEDRTGRFKSADKGTLFLDEIGNISIHQQAKLLSILQNRQVTPVGSNHPIDMDIRLICATNLSMTELANESRFRKDLIYRINTVEILVPPLREREGDILILTKHFSKMYADKYMKAVPDFDTKAIEKLKQYHFPGNVRELQYTIERAVIMADNDTLTAADLIFSPLESAVPDSGEFQHLNLNLVEKNTILKVIEKHHGNITKAAKELGITRTALYRRLSKYEL